MPEYYIGLMSGTSLDGVDGVLADCDPAGMRVLHHAYQPFTPELAAELLQLNRAGDNELHRAALAANALSRVYAAVVADLLQRAALPASAVSAIGAHGQTVRHQPGAWDGTGYTLQLNNPALLAELSGITVVADFRSRDVAAGGLILECAGGRFWREPIAGKPHAYRILASNSRLHRPILRLARMCGDPPVTPAVSANVRQGKT